MGNNYAIWGNNADPFTIAQLGEHLTVTRQCRKFSDTDDVELPPAYDLVRETRAASPEILHTVFVFVFVFAFVVVVVVVVVVFCCCSFLLRSFILSYASAFLAPCLRGSLTP